MTDENRALLAHLFRRAGFGAKAADLDKYTSKGYSAAVNDLLSARPTANPTSAYTSALSTNTTTLLKSITHSATSTFQDFQTSWVQQMVTTNAVLFERMVLFLSNHFATAYTPSEQIDIQAMARQQTTIRKYALGSFKE